MLALNMSHGLGLTLS